MISWSEVQSWKVNVSGSIEVVLSDGKKRYLNQMGDKKFDSDLIAILKQYVGANLLKSDEGYSRSELREV